MKQNGSVSVQKRLLEDYSCQIILNLGLGDMAKDLDLHLDLWLKGKDTASPERSHFPLINQEPDELETTLGENVHSKFWISELKYGRQMCCLRKDSTLMLK